VISHVLHYTLHTWKDKVAEHLKPCHVRYLVLSLKMGGTMGTVYSGWNKLSTGNTELAL
jgi:hypothetical protein